jgi:hypothetical protein
MEANERCVTPLAALGYTQMKLAVGAVDETAADVTGAF